MVRALFDGTKTQTRRLAKFNASGRLQLGSGRQWHPEDPNAYLASPYGQKGDELWVKETWAPQELKLRKVKPTELPEDQRINYAANFLRYELPQLGPWRPSLFMRRWMSRITLEIVTVHLERLQDISEEDAAAEGVAKTYSPCLLTVVFQNGNTCQITPNYYGGVPKAGDTWNGKKVAHVTEPESHLIQTARDAYRDLWNRINGPDSWGTNPIVWVVQFKKAGATS